MSCQVCSCEPPPEPRQSETICDAPLAGRRAPCCLNEEYPSTASQTFTSTTASLVSSDVMRDVIIGLSDGLTVPFALTAGLASTGSSRVVVLAGVAELISGAISMGAGGYLSAKTEYDHSIKFRGNLQRRLESICSREKEVEVRRVMKDFDVSHGVSQALTKDLARNSDKLLNFVLQLGDGVDEVAASRVYVSALTIGLSYLLGGLVPLLPYIFCHHLNTALFISIGVTGLTLFLFGAVKQQLVDLDKQNGRSAWSWSSSLYGAASTLAVGGMAAGASYGIVRAIESRLGDGQTL